MIDIIIIAYRNYFLLDKQIEHWNNYMKGDFRLVIVDNTPEQYRQHRDDVIVAETNQIYDGISAGEAYDFAFKQCTADIVGTFDPDCFPLNPNMLLEVEEQFKAGAKCIGCSGTYPDFQRNIDAKYPEIAGHLAPVLWGQFTDRKLAMENTFVCDGSGDGLVVGWRLRKKIIDEKVLSIVWNGFYPFPDDDQIVFFGDQDKPQCFHLLKGCSSRIPQMPAALERSMNWGLSKWQ